MAAIYTYILVLMAGRGQLLADLSELKRIAWFNVELG